MVTKKSKPRVYLSEWMDDRGLSDIALAEKMGTNRETVHRWQKEPRRLNTQKLEALAAALDLEPQELWTAPGSKSIDAMLAGADEKTRKRAEKIIQELINDD